MIKSIIRKVFHLQRKELGISFYFLDFLFRRIFRQNAGVKWAVHHTSTIKCPGNIGRGVGVWPGDSPNVYINALNGIYFGDFSNIGPNVVIASANHDPVNNELMIEADPIKIGRFCWVGGNSTILPSVVLGDFTIVGAGSVVTKSFKDGYCIIGGNPAKIIRSLDKEACDLFAETRKKNENKN